MSIEGFEAHSPFRQAISCCFMAKPDECYQSLLSLRRPDVDNQQTAATDTVQLLNNQQG